MRSTKPSNGTLYSTTTSTYAPAKSPLLTEVVSSPEDVRINIEPADAVVGANVVNIESTQQVYAQFVWTIVTSQIVLAASQLRIPVSCNVLQNSVGVADGECDGVFDGELLGTADGNAVGVVKLG